MNDLSTQSGHETHSGLAKQRLRSSARIHARSNPATNPREFVELIDRFVDGPVRYPLEWDDFISWRNENPYLEQARERIGAWEPLLFSKSVDGRREYVRHLLEERNRAAALVGLPARALNSSNVR